MFNTAVYVVTRSVATKENTSQYMLQERITVRRYHNAQISECPAVDLVRAYTYSDQL